MKILVTGGAGFIGSQIQDKLLELGHEVAVLDNLRSGKEKNLNPKAKHYNVDLQDKVGVTQAFEEFRPEVLYHLAAQIDVGYSMSHVEEDALINVVGTINLLEAAKSVGVKKIVYSNTGGAYYGSVPTEDMPVTEDYPVRFPTSAYGVSKLSAEHYIKLYSNTYGIQYISLRYANVFGPRQDGNKETGVVAIFVQRMMENQPITINGDGEFYRDYVYVEDVVEANIKALDFQDSDYFNIGTGEGISVNQVFQAIEEILQTGLKPSNGPERPGDVRAMALNTQKAQEKLGWTPKHNFKTGVQKTIEYYQQKVKS